MTRIVGIHGIAQELKGPNSLASAWSGPLQDGVKLGGGPELADTDISVAFYGDLFRTRGAKAIGEPRYSAADLRDPDEQELLFQWWQEASRVDPAVVSPTGATKIRTPRTIQRALNALSNSKFFAGLSERLLIGLIKQVHLYLTDTKIRDEALARVEAAVNSDTRVIVGHSLGSVIAYEALCANTHWDVALVTLGCPLGVRNIVFDRLTPKPIDGHGPFPGGARSWTNIADSGDVVALVKNLGPLFGEEVKDRVVHNGVRAHDVAPYLTAVETGHAITDGLRNR